jgi:predicted O-methyltransferase YrrM
MTIANPRIAPLIDELDALRATRPDAYQIPRDEGVLLAMIALSTGARVIVEVGTSYGFSGLFWGAALEKAGGVLHTIDADPRKFESARATFERAGLSGVITNHLGDAHAVLPTLDLPIDIVFLDADKASTRDYFDIVWPRVRWPGSVLTDNAVTHRDELADFVHYVRSRPDTMSTEIPIGNGLEWTVKAERAAPPFPK